ncbi:MAG: restriction endonuclease subunit S [Clostridia bacterium]|jgi:type I restriction enzyme S subunit|nr:restriction endonuclease subunit S [Clostridia bacterium]
MSKLEELIEGLCPKGVEYKSVGSMITRIREKGKIHPTIKQVYVVSKTLGIVRSEDFHENEIHSEDTSNYTVIRHGMFAYNPSRLNIGSLGVLTLDTPGLVSPMYVVFTIDESKIIKEYLLYNLRSSLVKNKIDSLKEEGARFRFDFERWDKINIPVPPLPVQREIVRILDNFTNLTAELTAELAARKTQYEYYLNYFINENVRESDEYIKLGELFDFRNGLNKGKDFFGKGTPIIRYTDVYNKRFLHKEDITALVECNERELEALQVSRGDVLFTRTSETAEEVGFSSVMLDDMDNCVFNGFTIKATPKTDKLLPNYCAYCFSTIAFRDYVTRRCTFTTRASLTGKTLSEFLLVVPSIANQKRIVSILDRFYSLCNDIYTGLPAEIEARQKQYEYYRDKLLTFKELS